jgi:prolyl oligopeptidase
MNKFLSTITLLSFGLGLSAQSKFSPPATPAIPVVDTLHGVLLTDDYRWLEDKKDPNVLDWTQKQHDYTLNYLDQTQKKHPGLREEVAAYIDLDVEGPLNKVGKRVFQNIKRKGDKQNKVYTLLDGKKILIWDPVKLDSTGSTSTQGFSYTYDGERAAISVQKSGAEISTTYIIETRSGKILFGPFENLGGFQWTKRKLRNNCRLKPTTGKWATPSKRRSLLALPAMLKTRFLSTITATATSVFPAKAIFIPTTVTCSKQAPSAMAV